MPSIVISSDDRELSQAIAERVAHKLDYTLVDPSILSAVAAEHEIPEDQLSRVLDSGAYRRVSRAKRPLALACVQAGTLSALERDKAVCTGLAAHVYVRDVSHVLTVRVLANAQALVNTLAHRQNVSLRKAQKILDRERERRSTWAMECFGGDEGDPAQYDMVFSLGQIERDKVVEIIADMASYRKFRANSYSRKQLADLAAAARARVALLPGHSDLRVTADGDKVIVRVKCPKRQRQQCAAAVKEKVRQICHAKLVEVHTVASIKELG